MTPQQFNCLKEICTLQRKNGYCPSYKELTEALGLKSRSGIHRLVRILTEQGYIERDPNHARSLRVNFQTLPLVIRESLGDYTTKHSHDYNSDYYGGQENGRPPLTLQEKLSPDLKQNHYGKKSAKTHSKPQSFAKLPIQSDFLKGRMLDELAGNSCKIPFFGAIAAGTPFEALSEHSTVNVPSALLSFGKHYALEARGDSMENAGISDGDTLVIRNEITAREGHIVVALIDQTHVTLKYYFTSKKNGQTSIILKAANPHYNDIHLPSNKVVIQGRLVALLRVYT